MSLLLRLFFRGLAALLPLVLTGYALWVAISAGEHMLRRVVLLFLPPEDYWPGMGFALSIALVLLIGLLMYSWVVRQVHARVTALIERIPVVKSIYGMLADVLRLVGSAEERPFRKVVLVTLADGLEQVGFLTREDFTDLRGIDDERVAVYLPMSYQLGGFTVVVARQRVREIEMPVEDALRFCVTAGVAHKSA